MNTTFEFDLQLFALVSSGVNATVSEGSMGDIDPQGTGAPYAGHSYRHPNNDLAPEMKVYYDKKLIEMAKANLVHQQFGQKRPIPENGGKTIEFRKFESLPKALTPLTEGVTPAGQSLTVTAVPATVEQYGNYVGLSDVLELTAIDNVVYESVELLGDQAGRTLDTIVRDIISAGTNVLYCPKIDGTTGAETEVTSRANLDETSHLTVSTVKKAVAILRGQNAPTFDGYYVAIIHPYAAWDIMNDPAWEEIQNYATPENRLTGEIGRIGGVRFVESTEAKIVLGENDLPIYLTLFIGKNAYGVTDITGGGLRTIIKQKGSAGTADPLDQRSTVGWKGMLTAEILVQQYLLRVESANTGIAATAN